MKKFTIPATTENLKWCDENLMDVDWDLKENDVDITIFYQHEFQKSDIINEIERLKNEIPK